MPIIKSAIKRARQAVVRRERNVATKKNVKATLKAFQAKPSASTLSELQSAIDTAVKKNVLDPRTAARRKATYSKQAKEAGVKLASGTKKPTAKPAAKKATTAKPVAKKAPAKKPAAKTTAKNL